MRTNNNLVDFASISIYVGSESLVQEVKDKHSDIYLNFAYTDYGVSFLDKVIISYFKEYYQENIVHEKTSWNGENAFSFGNGTEKDFERYCKDNHCKIISESYFYKEIHSLPFNEQITHIQFIREQLSLYNNL